MFFQRYVKTQLRPRPIYLLRLQLSLFLCLLLIGGKSRANEVSVTESIERGSYVHVCDDTKSSVDEIASKMISERSDLYIASQGNQNVKIDLAIISHRSVISRHNCSVLTLDEQSEIYRKYERVSIYREAAAKQIPELAEALRGAFCQPLYGMTINSGKRVAVVLLERKSATIDEERKCAERLLSFITTYNRI